MPQSPLPSPEPPQDPLPTGSCLSANVVPTNCSHLVVPVSLRVANFWVDTFAMIDSGATRNFVDKSWTTSHSLQTVLKKQFEPIYAINNSRVSGGSHHTEAYTLSVGPVAHQWTFEVADIAHYPLILGQPWLRKANPAIDWVNQKLTWPTGELLSTRILFRHEAPTEIALAGTAPIPDAYLSFSDLFTKSNADILPKHTEWDHEIPLEPGSKPPFGPVFGMSPTELDTLKEYIDDMLKRGFIRKSESPAGSPVIFVKKKDGTLRLCVDYRGLNTITIKNRTPLPLINETLDRVRDAQIYTRLDLRGAYNLIRIKEGEEWKTAFRTRYGLFEYLVMPFGLTNAPATFQTMINDVLRPFLDVFVVVYLDDILIFSNSLVEHEQHVKKVLKALSQFDLFVKAEKCEWSVTTTEFLGYVLSPQGIHMSDDKLKAIQDWPTPKSKHDVQVFMGFCNFYRRFIEGFSRIAKPMYELTGSVPWNWTPRCQTAFDVLKQKFAEAPMLLHYDPSQPAFVETDASNYALGAILSQRDPGGKLHPVAYFARSLSKPELNYEIYDKELLGIVEAMKEWRTYLEGAEHPITVLTDHKNLEYFTTTKTLNQRQARWSELLSRYNFRIKYTPGHNNKADALSRRPDFKPIGAIDSAPPLLPPSIFLNAAVVRAPTLDRIIASYPNDPTRTMPNPQGIPLTLRGGLVYKDHQIYVPEMLRKEILLARHASPVAGHNGVAKTFDLIQREFWWPSLRKDVLAVVSQCDVCQRTKVPRHLPHGYLQPLPTPNRPWSSLSMDFIVKLPVSQGFDSILVVVDRLTKMAHFLPCNETIDAPGLAQLYIKHIFRIHGLPESIISDRGSTFLSKFWLKVVELLSITPKPSTAFHPETDGQTERVNQCLEQFLRCYTNHQQDDWSSWLPIAEFQYNNCQNTSTGSSPFYANYGFHPRMDFLSPQASSTASNPLGEQLVARLQRIQSDIQAELAYAKATYKEFADRRRKGFALFKTGDFVYLSRKHLRSSRPSNKLDDKYIGPFRISSIVGNHSAYRLELPSTLRIHPVFHPSLLKRANRDPSEPLITPATPIPVDAQPQYEVRAILDVRGRGHHQEFFIDWVGYGVADRTWEPARIIKQDVPLLVKAFIKANK